MIASALAAIWVAAIVTLGLQRVTLDRKQRTINAINDCKNVDRVFSHYLVNYKDKDNRYSKVFNIYEEGLSRKRRRERKNAESTIIIPYLEAYENAWVRGKE